MNQTKIGRENIEDILGLTAMQEGMLYHYLSDPHSRQYFEQIQLSLSGKIEIESFKEAWQAAARNNEMLRAVVRWEKLDEPVQIILKEKEIPVRVFDLSRGKNEEQKRSLVKIISDDKAEKIDLRQEPLRITLCILGERQIEMLITFHHILFDGWSNGVILSEFFQAYNSLLKQEKPPRLQKTKYKEFFKWYRSQDREKQERFWETTLRGFDTRTLLPYDMSKLAEIRTVAAHKVAIPQATRELLDTCLQEHSITLALFLFSAWGILLQKYNNSDDVIFGVTAAGRT
ncbi:MAG: condensation domain-containing protein, partial [Candidatus Aminicenantes bacterium]|nr:condensation domain-containing protein [Candidatus Aminicenantes bacterium]